VYLHVFAWYPLDSFVGLDAIAELARKKKKPIVVWTMGDSEACGRLSHYLEELGIPAVDEISKGIRVLAAMTSRKSAL